MTINPKQCIGNVLFIVEGAKSEFAILKHIFTKIFNFSLIIKKRYKDTFEQYKSNNDNYSKIAIINTKESNIKFVGNDGEQYLDQLFETLINKYDFDVDNSSIFYLFDRDHQSNKDVTFIKSIITILRNPLDNGNNKAGELLLSYPGIETYKLSFLKDDIHLLNDTFPPDKKIVYCNQLKNLIHKEGLGNIGIINQSHIMHACNEFLNYLLYTANDFDIDKDLDDFSEKSIKIFDNQEKSFTTKGYYDFFSMLSLAFIQLGLINI